MNINIGDNLTKVIVVGVCAGAGVYLYNEHRKHEAELFEQKKRDEAERAEREKLEREERAALQKVMAEVRAGWYSSADYSVPNIEGLDVEYMTKYLDILEYNRNKIEKAYSPDDLNKVIEKAKLVKSALDREVALGRVDAVMAHIDTVWNEIDRERTAKSDAQARQQEKDILQMKLDAEKRKQESEERLEKARLKHEEDISRQERWSRESSNKEIAKAIANFGAAALTK